jgi:hypothetical protein
MRNHPYRFCFALALAGALAHGTSQACQPPAGFVNPPRPDIAPLDQLVAHSEQKVVARSMAEVMKGAARPLEEAIRPTKDLPGVSGTFRLSEGPYGSVGARRLVCLTDGNIAVEEVLLTESTPELNRFRYVVWNYTHPKFGDVHYGVGEFIRTQPEPDKTVVNWTYRFALKEGRDAERFRKSFLETSFAEWMRSVLFGGG